MPSRAYDAELRATIIAALLQGARIADIVREHNIPKSTVIRWRDAAMDAVSPDLVGPKKQPDHALGELVADYLQRSLRTLAIQAEFFSDRAWLQGQSAADVAILHGVVMDKTVRVLEALERAGERLPAGVDPRGDRPPDPAP